MEKLSMKDNLLRINSENTFNESEQIRESTYLDMIKKLNPGDLIKIHRGGYHHLALYIGEGYVIHLAPSSEYADAGVSGLKSIAQSIATVKKEKLQDVVGKDVYHIYNVLDNQSTPLPTPDIIQKAQSLVGTVLPYNLATRNCEHFVTELRYGTPKSQQVQNFVTVAGVIAVIVLIFICIPLLQKESKVSNFFGFFGLVVALLIVFHIVIKFIESTEYSQTDK